MHIQCSLYTMCKKTHEYSQVQVQQYTFVSKVSDV